MLSCERDVCVFLTGLGAEWNDYQSVEDASSDAQGDVHEEGGLRDEPGQLEPQMQGCPYSAVFVCFWLTARVGMRKCCAIAPCSCKFTRELRMMAPSI